MVSSQELWEFREFDRSITPKHEGDQCHLEQVRRYVLKNGFEEPLIISCDPDTGRAYIIEGNHRLWVAIKERIVCVPCQVIPQWLEPNGNYKHVQSNDKSKQCLMPEDLGLIHHPLENKNFF